MSRDTSFYYSFLVLPPRKRAAILAVWDFCRAVDDAVDEIVPESEWKGGLTAEARTRAGAALASWRDEIARCYGPESPQTPQGRALKLFVAECHLPRAQFETLVDGVEMDLSFARYPTFDALAEYCRKVASSVGLVCVEIFGYTDDAARAYAVNLGMALQITNIVRDVASDLRRGRIYLPAEHLSRFGVTEQALAEGLVTPQVRALLRYECEVARDYFRRAAADLPAADAHRLVAAEIMGGIYFEILQRIERAGYDVFSRRIRVPRPARAVIALRIWARALTGLTARSLRRRARVRSVKPAAPR